MFAFGETVVFEAFNPGAKDSHGNSIEAYRAGVPVDGWAFNPGGSVETYEPGRDKVVSAPQLLRQETDFIPGTRDRCTVRGRQYLVDGEPAVWKNPFTGWQPGLVVTLEAVDG